ncbi:lipid A biosynthesis acyltransferase [Marinomonas sp. SBI22]|uniref:lysophospholipid acyltransferase family protein n=1 Tax=unclassified Marinomonas TaxID=196814 RepID=UPI0007AF5D2D|nr:MULTISPECIES: lysophospholipid acyltransferase family protein [unclassified Marinomonas]KZM40247.1 lipid A biosynthesis acyltransferase [Marinomonas sp. SBI22]KZM41664.1 lipid A biosynthesis acyltransferase [Marinomonas sp. SBI8L]
MNNRLGSLFIYILRFLGLLPFSLVQKLGALFGHTFVKRNRRTVNAIDINLKLCLPEKNADQRLAIRNDRLKNMGQTALEMSHVWTKPKEQVLALLKPNNNDNSAFEEAVKSDSGVLVLAPHLGHWEMMNYYLAQFRPLTAMYRPVKNAKKLDCFIRDARERAGSELVPTDRKGVMQLMRALKSSGLVGILPDQVPKDGGGVYVPFYGQQAYSMTLTSQLVNKTGAKAFIGAAFRVKGGYEVAMQPVDEDFYSDDIETSVAAMNRSIEKLIELHPEQYQWEYKRFKKQPDGHSLYPRG